MISRSKPKDQMITKSQITKSRSSHQFFHHRILEGWANLLDQLRLIVWPCAVGQKRDGDFLFRIDPERSACAAEVSEGVSRKMLPRLRGGRWSVPAERARRPSGARLARGKRPDGIGRE